MNRAVTLEDVFPLIEEQLNAGGIASFVTHGTSMKPLLKNGENCVRLVRPKSKPKKYDVIFYRRTDGDFILHRIVGIGKDGFICRGDHQVINEYPVTDGQIIAVMTEYTKNGKWRSMDRFSQKVYARLRVNTVFFRRIFYRFYYKFKRK